MPPMVPTEHLALHIAHHTACFAGPLDLLDDLDNVISTFLQGNPQPPLRELRAKAKSWIKVPPWPQPRKNSPAHWKEDFIETRASLHVGPSMFVFWIPGGLSRRDFFSSGIFRVSNLCIHTSPHVPTHISGRRISSCRFLAKLPVIQLPLPSIAQHL